MFCLSLVSWKHIQFLIGLPLTIIFSILVLFESIRNFFWNKLKLILDILVKEYDDGTQTGITTVEPTTTTRINPPNDESTDEIGSLIIENLDQPKDSSDDIEDQPAEQPPSKYSRSCLLVILSIAFTSILIGISIGRYIKSNPANTFYKNERHSIFQWQNWFFFSFSILTSCLMNYSSKSRKQKQ